MKKAIYTAITCLLLFFLNFNQIFAQTKNEIKNINGKDYYIHVAKKNETLHEISQKYNTTVNHILSENENLIDGIKVGQEIKILVANIVISNQQEVKTKNEIKNINGKDYYFHIIEPYETLYSLSRKYDVSEKLISHYNQNLINGLQVGQEIKIPLNNYKLQQQLTIENNKRYLDSIQKNSTFNSLSCEDLTSITSNTPTKAEYLMFTSFEYIDNQEEFCKTPEVKINRIMRLNNETFGYKIFYYSNTGKKVKEVFVDLKHDVIQKNLFEYDSNGKEKYLTVINYLGEITTLWLRESGVMKDVYFEFPFPKSKEEAIYRYNNPRKMSFTETCPVCYGTGSSTGAVSGAKRCMGCNGAGKIFHGKIEY
jgi:LysM repeat protein